jgi:hypothetical protein
MYRANSQSLQIVYGNYPYSPRWPAKEIAARIKCVLLLLLLLPSSEGER